MRIVFTGGGSGGHFYPLIAVAKALNEIVEAEKIISPELYYIGPDVIDPEALMEQGIVWKKTSAGKVRRYLSIRNVFDVIKTIGGIFQATIVLYLLFPDVVFSKGGYASFPTTVAARILGIPIIVHESDAHPGRANKIAARWAIAVGTSFPGVVKYFKGVDADKFALVGLPIRDELFTPAREGGHEYLELDPAVPTILILGGSQGAQAINATIIDALPELLNTYQVIHQTGTDNLEEVRHLSSVVLKDHPYKNGYRAFGFLNTLALRMSAGIASLVISRAGTGTIFEIAAWGIPSIVVPIPEDVSHDQTNNAFAYARDGAAVVLKQKNLSKNILLAEIDRILKNPDVRAAMTRAAKQFAQPGSAHKMARIIIDTALKHEQ
tara:strand:+ start:20932 stop:22071 length:1140 start_codon:yes stop_codon:yes gene_type:complete